MTYENISIGEVQLPVLLPAHSVAPVSVVQRVTRCRVDRLLSATPEGDSQEGIIIRFDADAFDPSLYSLLGIVRPDVIARSVVKRQAEFFYGRLAANLALAAQGEGHINLPIGRSREPTWPRGWKGSISHTHGIAGAMVAPADPSRCSGIGLDLERIVDAGAVSAILQYALNDQEASLLVEAFAGNVEAGLTLGFSAKESLYKASFAEVGGFFDFDAARIVAVDTRSGMIELLVTRTLARRIPEGMHWFIRYSFPLDGLVVTHASWRHAETPS